MPKLFAFFSQEAKDTFGDDTLYYYILASDGTTVTATHISEDESGADYFWQDKKLLGEVTVKTGRPVDWSTLYQEFRMPAAMYQGFRLPVTVRDELVTLMNERVRHDLSMELNHVWYDLETDDRR